VEHETLLTTVSAGLCDIADALPRVELATILYPTDAMKQAVAMLYSHIMLFLMRALEWYEESRFKRALHSITKPAALSYNDIIGLIQKETRQIADSAAASSQAEQRDMHDELRAVRSETANALTQNHAEQQAMRKELHSLSTMISRLNDNFVLEQSINASARANFQLALSAIQYNQALALVSLTCAIDHSACFRISLQLRNRRRLTSRSKSAPFWSSSTMRSWQVAQTPTLLTLRATHRDRLQVRDYCTTLIEGLVRSKSAVLWALKGHADNCSAVDILKSLINQAVVQNRLTSLNEICSFHIQRFLNATMEEDYVDLLVDILKDFKLVYMVIEEAMMDDNSSARIRTWLQKLPGQMSREDSGTLLKILVFRYGPGMPVDKSEDQLALRIPRTSQRKSKKLPDEALQPMSNRGGHRSARHGRLKSD
jgi:hypothetical protein